MAKQLSKVEILRKQLEEAEHEEELNNVPVPPMYDKIIDKQETIIQALIRLYRLVWVSVIVSGVAVTLLLIVMLWISFA